LTRYMLDTNIIFDLIRNPQGEVANTGEFKRILGLNVENWLAREYLHSEDAMWRRPILDGGKMARPKRFELLTPRFVVWCSIQLSYGRVCR
jgi:hypothetical protein